MYRSAPPVGLCSIPSLTCTSKLTVTTFKKKVHSASIRKDKNPVTACCHGGFFTLVQCRTFAVSFSFRKAPFLDPCWHRFPYAHRAAMANSIFSRLNRAKGSTSTVDQSASPGSSADPAASAQPNTDDGGKNNVEARYSADVGKSNLALWGSRTACPTRMLTAILTNTKSRRTDTIDSVSVPPTRPHRACTRKQTPDWRGVGHNADR